MIDAIVFPEILLVESTHSWSIAASTFSPGQTAGGAFPFGRLDGGGVWTTRPELVIARERDNLLCYRAVRSLCQGGARPIVMRCNEAAAGFPPWPIVDGVALTSRDPIPHSDGSFFSDGSGYEQSVISAQTVGDALLRATSLTLAFLAGDALRGGERFAILHAVNNWRLYEITTVVLDDDGNSVVSFEPPLREATPGATPIEFDRPRCTMRLTNPQAMPLDITKEPYIRSSLSFVEYPWSVD